MCGIAGIVNFKSVENMEGVLRSMLGIIRHRGPDSYGIYLDDGIGLASARLSIIDLDTGDQPIHNEDRSIWIVLNGEIFNYPELRDGLENKGHHFYTRSDTEVLVHLYEDLGPEFLGMLNGQFAIALWDTQRKTVLLARDRLGIRPLFYHRDGDRLVFGSEVKALFMDPSVLRKIKWKTISDIFTCWAPVGEETAFEDVYQIPAGHFGLFSRNGLVFKSYWSIDFGNSEEYDRPLSYWVEELNDRLLDATRIRLRSDVPVGAYLSGGLDSTYISTLIKRNFNNALCTFSVGFADSRFDEASFQQKAVESIRTLHKSIRCTEEDIGNVFERVIWHSEVPFLRTAPGPLFLLSRLVRENNFKVVLTGEGADELFAGYNIFKEDLVRRFWAKFPDSVVRPRLLERLYPYILSQENGKAKKFLTRFFKKGLTQVDSPVYSHLLRWENTSQLKSFFSSEIREEMGTLEDFIEQFISGLPRDFMSWTPISRAQYTEISIFLSNYLLSSQGDRMAMGNSVEGRFPYLDHHVIEFAARIPVRYRVNGLKEKFLLKKAAEGLIPEELIGRAKQPYRAPISRCFLGPSAPVFAKELLSENSVKEKGFFDYNRVKRLISKCTRQEGNLLSERENMALVGILSTQLLDELFIKNFPPYPIKEPERIKHFSQAAGQPGG
jgi:asparagine synthase (glutamine-hydrolysing)